MIGEDALDRYLVRPLEDRVTNRWVRLALRSALNPTRSFANVLDSRTPWHRDSRAGVGTYSPAEADSLSAGSRADRAAVVQPAPGDSRAPAPLEFAVVPSWRHLSTGGCAGGGADAAYRVAPHLQVAVAVGGCKLRGLPKNVSGDILV